MLKFIKKIITKLINSPEPPEIGSTWCYQSDWVNATADEIVITNVSSDGKNLQYYWSHLNGIKISRSDAMLNSIPTRYMYSEFTEKKDD